ncbi:hypothetical protein EVAR_14435_1 [Eumeta japonica]|uniref:Uncharacterized protein n=1 Tax=Eumeta variegata TaxID=151549 RepID=A0A4C1TXA3_EUMVA|nr:hypothetical protein EVAR_14435_1 [Eumeta japonica]
MFLARGSPAIGVRSKEKSLVGFLAEEGQGSLGGRSALEGTSKGLPSRIKPECDVKIKVSDLRRRKGALSTCTERHCSQQILC